MATKQWSKSKSKLIIRFCHVLDARKSGLSVLPEVKSHDMKTFAGALGWRTWKKNEVDRNNERAVKRHWIAGGDFIVSGRTAFQNHHQDCPIQAVQPSM
jgi:hypothetical protein